MKHIPEYNGHSKSNLVLKVARQLQTNKEKKKTKTPTQTDFPISLLNDFML